MIRPVRVMAVLRFGRREGARRAPSARGGGGGTSGENALQADRAGRQRLEALGQVQAGPAALGAVEVAADTRLADPALHPAAAAPDLFSKPVLHVLVLSLE